MVYLEMVYFARKRVGGSSFGYTVRDMREWFILNPYRSSSSEIKSISDLVMLILVGDGRLLPVESCHLRFVSW